MQATDRRLVALFGAACPNLQGLRAFERHVATAHRSEAAHGILRGCHALPRAYPRKPASRLVAGDPTEVLVERHRGLRLELGLLQGAKLLHEPWVRRHHRPARADEGKGIVQGVAPNDNHVGEDGRGTPGDAGAAMNEHRLTLGAKLVDERHSLRPEQLDRLAPHVFYVDTVILQTCMKVRRGEFQLPRATYHCPDARPLQRISL
mmetsp:Transcript_99374/g.278260  ORF Transcript_99374/g.278260 Transcript_99374/m.278260 type:complete len:205 (-) Transcript_99374:117-731(-)